LSTDSGDLVLDEHGIAKRGLLIRHLVMPRDIVGTRQVMNWIAPCGPYPRPEQMA